MRHVAGLPVVAVLALATTGAQAFTIENQNTTNNATNYTVNNFGATNYGSTLATPGQPRSNFGDAFSSGSSTANSTTGSQMGGFSFHVGPQSSFGASNMRPPAWSTNPLYLDRGQ
jgi:hypothetical protein